MCEASILFWIVFNDISINQDDQGVNWHLLFKENSTATSRRPDSMARTNSLRWKETWTKIWRPEEKTNQGQEQVFQISSDFGGSLKKIKSKLDPLKSCTADWSIQIHQGHCDPKVQAAGTLQVEEHVWEKLAWRCQTEACVVDAHPCEVLGGERCKGEKHP